MTARKLKVPECLHFNRAVWNSEPFNEHFLYNLKAKRYYLLDDSDCRTALINLFSILDFWTLQTESQQSVRTIFSSLCILLAVNIRESELVPLVESFNEEEFALDSTVNQRFEKPISKWNQVLEEIQNAVRSVEKFDIVAPALAWAIVRFLIGGVPVSKTVDSDLSRWKRNGTPVQLPRGCVAFLERKLPLVKNFSFLPSDLTTLVKATAVYFKHSSTESASTATTSLKRQLATFTKYFIDKDLGPWIPVEEIADGSLERQSALIGSFQKDDEDEELAQAIRNLSRFHENVAKELEGFKLLSHYVYSGYKSQMLTYMNNSVGRNSALCAEIYRVKDVLSQMHSVEDLDCEASEGESAPARVSARQRAKKFLMLLPSEERLSFLKSAADSQTETATTTATISATPGVSQPGKRKKRRKRKH